MNSQELNDPGPLYAVACAADVDDLHVIGITTGDGALWYTTRTTATTTWTFSDDVGCAVTDNGDLHVIATTGDGELWLTSLSAATGSRWEPFVKVKTLVSDYPGPFLAVSIASPVNFIQ